MRKDNKLHIEKFSLFTEEQLDKCEEDKNPNKLIISDKPIRLIELFSGIGAQASCFERLVKNGLLPLGFEHYKICDFDPYAVVSYNGVHKTNFKHSDITQIHAKDLEIVETNKYNYVCTYSFPCQDISVAGLGKSLEKGSGTRSGLLWEFERILNECDELPQILLLENVKNLISSAHKEHFDKWLQFLESKGYKSEWKVLNAADFGVPQHRERVFVVSWLDKSKTYKFPKPFPLEKTMEDILDDVEDEKYYLSDDRVRELIKKGNVQVEFDE